MKESTFRSKLKNELKILFPGAIVSSLDPNDIQGIPDLLILYKNRWACLETKKSIKASKRPNQEYYVNLMNSMSFAAFIYPENKEAILNALQHAFGVTN